MFSKNACYSTVKSNKHIIGYATDMYEFGKDKHTIETVDIDQNKIFERKFVFIGHTKKILTQKLMLRQ